MPFVCQFTRRTAAVAEIACLDSIELGLVRITWPELIILDLLAIVVSIVLND
jgi:hypothetical protein